MGIPDLFNGDPLSLNRPADFDLMSRLTKGSDGKNPHTYDAVDPIVEKSIKYLQEQDFKKIGAVGYCFGAKYVARFMAAGKGISVGFVAHPSFIEEEELLVQTKQPYQINLYSGVAHGFSVRCDTSKKIEKYAKEQAFLQAVAWFDEHLI